LPDAGATCVNCEACCCRLEVILITDTGVPDAYVEVDEWPGCMMAAVPRWIEMI
jgi:hypothetical protein